MKDVVSPYPTIADVPESSWKKLGETRIFFGHMSVGFNIMEGIQDLMNDNRQIKVTLSESSDPALLKSPVFAHSRIGKNHDPLSKLDAFKQLLITGLGDVIDVAFLKFCFVDITEKTDIHELMKRYKETLDSLQKKNPKTKFIHVTVPLTTVEGGIKAFIKKLIGRHPDRYADNITRNEYNDLLRKQYPPHQIFDLAAMESTLPDGTRATFSHQGRTYYCLAPEFTKDRGHLNSLGRQRTAVGLLRKLVDTVH